MKKLIIILFVLPFIAISQTEANNFKIDQNKVVWQKIYEDNTVSFDDLVNTVKSNTNMTDIDIYEDKITMIGNNIETNPRSSGFSRGSTSFYALGNFKAYFTIDFKPGRYRITAINISSMVPSLNLLAPALSGEELSPLEDAVIGRGELKKGFIKKESKIISDAFEKQFVIIKQTDDNW